MEQKPEEIIVPEIISGPNYVRQLVLEIKGLDLNNKKLILEKSTILMLEWKKIGEKDNRDLELLKKLAKEINDTFVGIFGKIMLDLKKEATSLQAVTVLDNFGQKCINAASFYGELMKLGIFKSSI